MSKRSDDGETLAVGVGLLALVALIVLLWLACQATALVLKTCAAHPENKPLRWAVGVALVATLAALATGLRVAGLNALAGLALLALVTTSWLVQTYHDQLFQRPLTRQRLVEDVLQRPWW